MIRTEQRKERDRRIALQACEYEPQSAHAIRSLLRCSYKNAQDILFDLFDKGYSRVNEQNLWEAIK